MGTPRTSNPRDPHGPQPEVWVTARVPHQSPDGWKERGESYQLPMPIVDANVRGGYVIEGQAALGGVEDLEAGSAETQINKAFYNQYDAKTVPNPEEQGSAGLAAVDMIVNDQGLSRGRLAKGAMFRDDENIARERAKSNMFNDSMHKIEETVQAQEKAAGLPVQDSRTTTTEGGYERKDVQPQESPGRLAAVEEGESAAEQAEQAEDAPAGEPDRDQPEPEDRYAEMRGGQLDEELKSRGISGYSSMGVEAKRETLRANDRGE